MPANYTGAEKRNWFQEKESGPPELAAWSEGAGSQLFALVSDMQFELRSFKAHQHTAKLVPADLSTIDHEKRDAAATIVVPFDPATHQSLIRDLRSMYIVCEMFARQCATHLFDQTPEQHHQIVLRISDDLELVASRTPVAKLEGVERNSRPEQMGTKVELVEFSGTSSETYRFELGIFELLQAG